MTHTKKELALLVVGTLFNLKEIPRNESDMSKVARAHYRRIVNMPKSVVEALNKKAVKVFQERIDK